MYGVFKITDYPYCVKCSVHKTANDATAEVEWLEEHGKGQFIVKKIRRKDESKC